MILDISSFDCSQEGGNSVTLTVTDSNNNSSTCQANVTVEDKVAPVALCKNNVVNLDAVGYGSISTVHINNGSNDACGILSVTLNNTSFDCSNVGSNTVTLTVTDNNNNTSTCQATVTVMDNISPMALCQNHIVQLDGNGDGSITTTDVDNGSTDACGIASMSLDKTSFNCTNMGGNLVKMTVVDNSNNNNFCLSIISVVDNVAPIALCQNHTVQLDASGGGLITTTDIDNGSTDACGIQSLSLDNNSFSCSDVGANTVTLTVTDNNGNTSTCQATITVEDNIAPTALCNDVSISLDGNGNGALSVSDVNNNSFDNCGIASMVLSQTVFNCSDMGAKVITLTVIDINDNSSTCISNISTEISGALEDGWTGTDIGQVTVGNDYWYDPCEYPPLYYVTGSGNNTTATVTDNVAFIAHNTCGDFTFTTKIESVDPNGYGGVMVREGMEAGAKQVALFSNLSNILRHEARHTTGGVKQVGSFFQPSPIWLKIQRQGDWIFSYSSYDGVNFQYVHGVFIQMVNCLEVGMVSFTYMPNAQTEVVFSNVSISVSNGGFSEGDLPLKPSISESTIHNLPPTPTTLFPNPNNGQFQLKLEKPLEENTTLHIFNQYGQQMYSQQLRPGDTQWEFMLDQMPSGTYWLKLSGSTQAFSTKAFTLTR